LQSFSTRVFERYVQEGHGNRHRSIGALMEGTWMRGSFTGDFERKVRFFWWRGGWSSVTVNSERYVKEGSGSRHLSA